MPIGTLGDPNLGDSTNPVEAPAAETHHLLGAIHHIRLASIAAYFSGKLNSKLQKRIGESKWGILFTPSCFS